MKQKTKNIIAGILIIGIVVGILIGIRGNFKELAILSQSSIAVNETDNKVYWVITGTAENLDSGYSFTRTFSAHTKQDGSGTTVTPQDSLTLNIKTREKSCTYQLYGKESTLYRLTIIPYVWYYDFQYTYQLLLSPEKTFLIDFTPNKGNSIILDGSLQNSATIQDPDGNGKVTVQTQGALETKYDCPTNADVAVIRDGSSYKIVDKSDLETALNDVGSTLIKKIIDLILNGLDSSLLKLISDNFQENIAFTGAFESYPQVGSSYIKGIKDMGNPIFTITADQDYFNSVVYTPPTSSDPFIDQINQNDIKQGSTGGVNVVVKNRNSNQGSVTLTISAPYAYFSPSGETFVLSASGSAKRYFIETANNIIIDNPITAKVCTNNQFGTNKCNSKTVIQKILPDGYYCGDGICQSTENSATCPDDCHYPTNCTENELTCTSNNECCSKFCSNGVCKPKTSCSSCWAWLKDKMGIQQDCEVGFFRGIWDSLKCPFYFLKLSLILVASICILLFGQAFSEKTFRNIPYWATWIIAVILSGLVGVLAYMFLEWYYVIPILVVLFIFGIIVNAIPGKSYIRGVIGR